MNDEPPASFSIVILASGGVDAAVVEQLDRLATLSGPPREVCLVHGPLPGPLVPDVTGRVKLVHEPLGHDAVARNHGLANAAGDAVVFHTASPPAADLLAVLCEAFSDRGVAAVVSGPECVAFRRVDLQAMRGFDEARVRLLVNTNWLRTVAWTLRAVLIARCETSVPMMSIVQPCQRSACSQNSIASE
jgi:hypothetical protein